jgi:SAM-dependent methyltransferase
MIKFSNLLFNFFWIKKSSLSGSKVIEADKIVTRSKKKVYSSEYRVAYLLTIRKFMNVLNSNLDLSTRVFLDLGCGAGIPVCFVSKYFDFQSFQGIDFSPSLIAKAKENYMKLNSQINCDFIVGEIGTFELEAEKAYIVFAFNPCDVNIMCEFIQLNLQKILKNETYFCLSNDRWTQTLLDRFEFETIWASSKLNACILRFI